MRKLFDVPLFSQSWNLKDWHKLGFISYEDAKYWERSSCGVLCLQMAYSFFYKKSRSTPELIKLGQSLGAYDDKTGWSHKGLVELASKIGLNASVVKASPSQLCDLIDKGEIPIVSIKWAFLPVKSLREKVLFWKRYGGHLAVIAGYEKEGDRIKGFYVNHTSIQSEYNWKQRLISVEDFMAGYTGRVVVISKA